jgi:hypothetical protein
MRGVNELGRRPDPGMVDAHVSRSGIASDTEATGKDRLKFRAYTPAPRADSRSLRVVTQQNLGRSAPVGSG